jgi:hypothetical protein
MPKKSNESRVQLLKKLAQAVIDLDPAGEGIAAALSNLKEQAKVALAAEYGNPDMDKMREDAVRVRQLKAVKFRNEIAPVIAEAKAQGRTGLRDIAKYLNEHQVETPSGRGVWFAVTVKRVMEHLEVN